jgi:molybdopterin-guanine dinucleotide biosynthesis protein A
LEKQLTELARSGVEEVIILANNPLPYKAFGSKIVPDLRAGTGPLGGIETAVSYYASRFQATLFLPCDLPGITARQIKILKEGFVRTRAGVAVAVTEGGLREPLCAVVDNRLLPAISKAIDEETRKVGEVWQSLDMAFVHFSDPEPFFNLNTPLDLVSWLAGQQRRNRGRCTGAKAGLGEERERNSGSGLAQYEGTAAWAATRHRERGISPPICRAGRRLGLPEGLEAVRGGDVLTSCFEFPGFSRG